MPASELRTNVEQVSDVVCFETSNTPISNTVLTLLIEQHAAPHWGLPTNEAWFYYNSGRLKITEVIPEELYRISLSPQDGILEVVLTGGD